MHTLARLTIIAAIATPSLVAAQDIVIDDFASGKASFPATTTVPLRRGVTSNAQIIKDLIDLVPFNMVSISGGGTISSINNGRTSSGKGFIRMNVTVPSGQSLGSIITLKVGLTDQFRFRAVHRGQVSSATASPQPSTITAGTPFTVTVQGTDLGNPVVQTTGLPCHTIAESNRSNTSVRFTLTRLATCTSSQFSFRLTPGAGGNEAPSYPLATGSPAGFSFSYLTPPVGLACSSQPSIGAPRITTPAAGQVLVFGSGTSSPTNIVVRWDSVTATNVAAPNNEWIVSRQVRTTVSRTQPTFGFTTVSTEVRGLSIALPFTIPGTHTVSIRAKNCGTAAPSSSVTFSTAVQ